jgi:hypothetical protein
MLPILKNALESKSIEQKTPPQIEYSLHLHKIIQLDYRGWYVLWPGYAAVVGA